MSLGSLILLKIASENRFYGRTYFYTIASRDDDDSREDKDDRKREKEERRKRRDIDEQIKLMQRISKREER